jgi:hypothetical protein
MLAHFPLRLTVDSMNPRSNIYRALISNPGTALPLDARHIYARNLEVPSGGAVGTARGIAHAYGVFANGGHELRLRPETLALLAAPAIPPTHGFKDECVHGEVRFSLGFMKPRRRELVRCTGRRRGDGIRRSGCRHRLRLRHQPDGDVAHRRPAGRRASGRAQRGDSRLSVK